MNIPVFVLAAMLGLAAAWPAPSRANGGPIDDSPGDDLGSDDAGRGDVVPVEEASIRLVSEKLRIFVDKEGWRAVAQYVLANSGSARAVKFGVPAFWTEPKTEEYARIAGAGAKRFRIEVAGRTSACSPVLGKTRTFDGPDGTRVATNGWCVATIVIPSGEAVPVTLSYPLDYAIAGYHGYKLFAQRGVYILAPAGYWKGPANQVDIEIDPGPYRGQVRVVWPPGFEVVEGKLLWRRQNVDLRGLKALVFDFDTRYHEAWRDGGWLRAAAEYRMSASSTLEPQGKHTYQAGDAADGEPASAWCEGAPGDGVGEWLAASIQLNQQGSAGCRVRDIIVIPGYARDDVTWTSNGRIDRARIEACSDPADGFEVRLPDEGSPRIAWLSPQDPLRRTWEIEVPQGRLERTPDCIRLRVLGVVPGKHPDLCISEFLPRVYCKAGK